MLPLLPRLQPRRLLQCGSHGLATCLFALLILHAGCQVRRDLAGVRHSLTLTRPSPKGSPFSVEKLLAPVPAAAATQIERTPPTSGSVRRLHVAQAQWAGARGARARRPTWAGGGREGRSARGGVGWGGNGLSRRQRGFPLKSLKNLNVSS